MQSGTAQGGKLQLLLVDDQTDKVQPDVERVFPSFAVTAFSDPLAALEAFQFSDVQPHVVLLDINFEHVWESVSDKFPGCDGAAYLGLHLLELFRKMDPDVPVAMITAYDRLASAFAAGTRGAAGFFVKTDVFQEHVSYVCDADLKAIVERTRYRYDRDQQQFAETVADRYRELEAVSAGTIAYWHFEETQLIELAGQAIASKGSLRVLDLGTGDGRFAEVLLRNFPERLSIVAVDYSGKMLAACRERCRRWSDRISYRRCIAEGLDVPSNEFDLVVAGFGFLSYCDKLPVLAELRRVGKTDADYLLGSYNYDALFYDVWASDFENPELPISGKINRDEGRLHIGNGALKVHPFTEDEMYRALLRQGFSIVTHDGCDGWTFPTLYASLPLSASAARPDETVDRERYHGCASFNAKLYEQDVLHSRHLKGRGYYRLHHCRKTADASILR